MTSLNKRLWSIAILSGIAATIAATPSAEAAKPGHLCPQFVAKYCVVEKDGSRQTVWTNPCFAKARGWRVLHLGACQGPICTFIYEPVCSINPYTGKQETYGNQCVSDVANATFLHKGVCK
jgi:hypothetical protein